MRRLSALALGIVLAALPLSGHALVCIRRCPQPAPPPALSKPTLANLIEQYLAEHPPVLRFQLRRSLGSYAPIAYDDLTRAGILQIVNGKRGHEPGPRYDLTAKGREFVAKLTGGKHIRRDASVIEIPVGQFRYVPSSAVLRYDEVPGTGEKETLVTFKYDFDGNENAALLLRLGPAIDWVIADSWNPYANLDHVGGVAEQTLPLQPCGRKWVVRTYPPYLMPCPRVL